MFLKLALALPLRIVFLTIFLVAPIRYTYAQSAQLRREQLQESLNRLAREAQERGPGPQVGQVRCGIQPRCQHQQRGAPQTNQAAPINRTATPPPQPNGPITAPAPPPRPSPPTVRSAPVVEAPAASPTTREEFSRLLREQAAALERANKEAPALPEPVVQDAPPQIHPGPNETVSPFTPPPATRPPVNQMAPRPPEAPSTVHTAPPLPGPADLPPNHLKELPPPRQPVAGPGAFGSPTGRGIGGGERVETTSRAPQQPQLLEVKKDPPQFQGVSQPLQRLETEILEPERSSAWVPPDSDGPAYQPVDGSQVNRGQVPVTPPTPTPTHIGPTVSQDNPPPPAVADPQPEVAEATDPPSEDPSSTDKKSCQSDAQEFLYACHELSQSFTAAEGAAYQTVHSKLLSSESMTPLISTLSAASQGSVTKFQTLANGCTQLSQDCTNHCKNRVAELKKYYQHHQQSCDSARIKGSSSGNHCQKASEFAQAMQESIEANNQICVGSLGELITQHQAEAAESARVNREARRVAAAIENSTVKVDTPAPQPPTPVTAPVVSNDVSGSSSDWTTAAMVGAGGAAAIGIASRSGGRASAGPPPTPEDRDEALIKKCGSEIYSDECQQFRKDYCAEQVSDQARPIMVNLDASGENAGRGKGSNYCNLMAQKIWCQNQGRSSCLTCSPVAQKLLFRKPGCLDRPDQCLQLDLQKTQRYQESCPMDPIWAIPRLASN